MKTNDKYFALAIEGLWKYILMVFDNMATRKIIKVQGFEE